MEQSVILVDEFDHQIGVCEKMEAHKKGLLHRAFSICVFDDTGRILLQKRADIKYHCRNLWSNTCCSHPRPNEDITSAAKRRLGEEMGFTTLLEKKGHVTYDFELGNGLFEHEYDHIFTGFYNGPVAPNSEEVSDYKWMSMQELYSDIEKNPDGYTPWFRLILEKKLV